MSKIQLLFMTSILLFASVQANAAVLNTLNGVNYEWLELTETGGLFRDEVEPRLADPNDVLYGYEYASGELVEDLLLSYASWDGLNGFHGAPDVVNGMDTFLDDFGSLDFENDSQIDTITVDGYVFSAFFFVISRFMYGDSADCGGVLYDSCLGNVFVEYTSFVSGAQAFTSFGIDPQAAIQSANGGWASSSPLTGWNPGPQGDAQGHWASTGSLLVRISPVPAPPVIWLFGIGLIGLIGFSKRRRTA